MTVSDGFDHRLRHFLPSSVQARPVIALYGFTHGAEGFAPTSVALGVEAFVPLPTRGGP